MPKWALCKAPLFFISLKTARTTSTRPNISWCGSAPWIMKINYRQNIIINRFDFKFKIWLWTCLYNLLNKYSLTILPIILFIHIWFTFKDEKYNPKTKLIQEDCHSSRYKWKFQKVAFKFSYYWSCSNTKTYGFHFGLWSKN